MADGYAKGAGMRASGYLGEKTKSYSPHAPPPLPTPLSFAPALASSLVKKAMDVMLTSPLFMSST